jgi:hypothetical protein
MNGTERSKVVSTGDWSPVESERSVERTIEFACMVRTCVILGLSVRNHIDLQLSAHASFGM